MGANLGRGPWDSDIDNIEEVYLANRGEFLVGEINGEIVAMGALRRVTDELAELKRVRVHPACQHQGLGQAIVNALEKRALEMCYSKLCLDTTTKQIPAQRLAEKNGFEKIGTRKVRSLELILYQKTLA
jgi:N-acetylglutamate synthase-like GNAT family acetyltransferase